MKIDPKRYDTEVDRSCAVGPAEISASISSHLISHGFGLTENEKVENTSRISIEALLDFPEKFQGHKLLAEIKGVENFRLWDDVDPDNKCLGNLRWFDRNTFHISAHTS
ncbi:MAG: hypothetical protein ACE5D4_05410 [Thermodesulfobacteriota bacterium]